MTYEQWELTVPDCIRQDSLWKMEAYRLGLFLSDLSWPDAGKLLKDRRTVNTADQLFRAVSKISSNIGEGYSRSTGRDRAHFYEYALGSAREARDWYYKARHVLGDEVVEHRFTLTTSLIRILIKMIANERRINSRIVSKR